MCFSTRVHMNRYPRNLLTSLCLSFETFSYVLVQREIPSRIFCSHLSEHDSSCFDGWKPNIHEDISLGTKRIDKVLKLRHNAAKQIFLDTCSYGLIKKEHINRTPKWILDFTNYRKQREKKYSWILSHESMMKKSKHPKAKIPQPKAKSKNPKLKANDKKNYNKISFD